MEAFECTTRYANLWLYIHLNIFIWIIYGFIALLLYSKRFTALTDYRNGTFLVNRPIGLQYNVHNDINSCNEIIMRSQLVKNNHLSIWIIWLTEHLLKKVYQPWWHFIYIWQYLLTCKVGRYCFLALRDSAHCLSFPSSRCILTRLRHYFDKPFLVEDVRTQPLISMMTKFSYPLSVCPVLPAWTTREFVFKFITYINIKPFTHD